MNKWVEEERMAELAPDGFPKYYVKKPPGEDLSNYQKPPERVEMDWRKRKINEFVQFLMFWKRFELPKLPEIPEEHKKGLRMTNKLIDFWITRAIFMCFTPVIKTCILLFSLTRMPTIYRAIFWKDGFMKFPMINYIFTAIRRSLILATGVRCFLFFDSIIPGPMFNGPLQEYFDSVKGSWALIFDDFFEIERLYSFCHYLMLLQPSTLLKISYRLLFPFIIILEVYLVGAAKSIFYPVHIGIVVLLAVSLVNTHYEQHHGPSELLLIVLFLKFVLEIFTMRQHMISVDFYLLTGQLVLSFINWYIVKKAFKNMPNQGITLENEPVEEIPMESEKQKKEDKEFQIDLCFMV